MKIFILGVTSFLRIHLANRILKLFHEVCNNDKFIGKNKENLNKQVKFFEVDCLVQSINIIIEKNA
jgi:nucleoside-diphosphate-sugar epimerase